MKIWVIAVILFINAVIQSAIFPFLQIVGVKPDTLMILVVSFALLAGSSTGLMVGLLGGLMQDILYGSSIGYNAFIYMIIGVIVGLTYEKMFVGKVLFPAIFVFFGVLLRGILTLILLFFIRVEIPFHQGFAVVILPEAVYTLLLMPLIYYFMIRLYEKKFMRKKWQFKRT